MKHLIRALAFVVGLSCALPALAADTAPRTSVEAIGGTTDAKCAVNDTMCSVVALLKGMYYNGIAVQPSAGTTGGCTPYHLAGGTAASTNSTSVKASAGNLCHLTAVNTTVTTYYLRLYDSASAPTCSSATGAKHTYPIPPSGGLSIPLPLGESYASGIGFCVTGGGSDTDNTNAAAGVWIEGSYK